MAPTERRRAAALDRSWDAAVRGEPMPAPDPTDASLTAIVARLQATSAIPTLFPNPEGNWRELRTKQTGRAPIDHSERVGVGPNGRQSPLGEPQLTPLPRRSPRHWLLSQLSAAALLLLSLAAGFLVLWLGAVREPGSEIWLPDSVVSSLPGYAEDVLFEATFAAAELPDGATEAVFYRVTLPPEAALPYLSAMKCIRSSCNKDAVTLGVGVEIVEAGSYGLHLDRPVWVQRAGKSAGNEEIPAGQDIVLRPGDAVVFHDYTATGEIRNAGSEPVELLGIAIVDYAVGGEPIASLPPEIREELLDVSLTSDWEELPSGPKTVTLRRVTVPAETILPPFEPRGLESIRVERGSIAWTFAHSAESAEGGLRIHRRAGETAPFAISPDGARRFLETTSDEPAELLVLTIEPAGLGGNQLAP